MTLHPHWRRILRYAWSVRLIALAGILSGLEGGLPYILPGLVSPGLCAILTTVVIGSAFVSRLVAQPNLT